MLTSKIGTIHVRCKFFETIRAPSNFLTTRNGLQCSRSRLQLLIRSTASSPRHIHSLSECSQPNNLRALSTVQNAWFPPKAPRISAFGKYFFASSLLGVRCVVVGATMLNTSVPFQRSEFSTACRHALAVAAGCTQPQSCLTAEFSQSCSCSFCTSLRGATSWMRRHAILMPGNQLVKARAWTSASSFARA